MKNGDQAIDDPTISRPIRVSYFGQAVVGRWITLSTHAEKNLIRHFHDLTTQSLSLLLSLTTMSLLNSISLSTLIEDAMKGSSAHYYTALFDSQGQPVIVKDLNRGRVGTVYAQSTIRGYARTVPLLCEYHSIDSDQYSTTELLRAIAIIDTPGLTTEFKKEMMTCHNILRKLWQIAEPRLQPKKKLVLSVPQPQPSSAELEVEKLKAQIATLQQLLSDAWKAK